MAGSYQIYFYYNMFDKAVDTNTYFNTNKPADDQSKGLNVNLELYFSPTVPILNNFFAIDPTTGNAKEYNYTTALTPTVYSDKVTIQFTGDLKAKHGV